MKERIKEKIETSGDSSKKDENFSVDSNKSESAKGIDDKVEEKKWDEINNELSEFEENKDSEELHAKWVENFRDQPALFINKENLEKLKAMPMHERLIMLAKTSRFLTFTPKLAEKYFEEFPDDSSAIEEIFGNCRGHPENGLDYNLFTIVGGRLSKADLSRFGNIPYYTLEQYQEIADRRDIAPSLLLDNFEYKYSDSFKEFGEGAEGFLKAFNEADELRTRGDHFINPEQIFTPEYEQMDEEKKASFLRKAVAELHFSLLFNETFNSGFTRERIERDKEFSKRGDLGFKWHNVAHSMIYKTYQPISVYELDQGYFEREMYSTAERGGDIEEYPFHRILLTILDRIKDVKAEKELNTDVLVDFWGKNRNPIFGNAVTEALINQNVNRAGKGLLELLRGEKTDKNSLAAILYRLELGRIGISKEGVKYLEKIYDLGELNNPDYFAQRLTAKGDIGIFDDERILQKYFNLGDLSETEKVIKPRVHEFVYETLFTKKEGETKEEREKREQYLKEFKENYFNFYENEFFQKTGIRFNNLDFKEQGWFLIYYKNADENKKKALLNFAKEHGENGLRTFLSLEHGEEMGDRILELGENFDSISAGLIFNKYAEIVDLGEQNTKDLSDLLKDKRSFSLEEIELIAKNSVKKGSDLLVNFSKKIKKVKEGEKGLAKNEVLSELENYKKNLILTALVYKSLKESGVEVNFEDFKGATFKQLNANQITSEKEMTVIRNAFEKAMPKYLPGTSIKGLMRKLIESEGKIGRSEAVIQMLEIYGRNYENKPKLQKAVLEAFLDKLEKRTEAVRLYLYEKDGEVIAFNRFDDEESGRRRFTSFNVMPELAGFKIGDALLDGTLKKETANSEILEAECLPETNISSHYIEKAGFVVKGITRNYGDTDETVFNIERSPQKKEYKYKSYAPEKLILEAEFSAGGQKDSESMVLKFKKNSSELIDVSEELINRKGYLMTRYFFDGDDVYCAFERGNN